MTGKIQTRSLQRRLLALAVIGTLITSLVVAISVSVPLYQQSKAHQELNLLATAENHAVTINGYLNMLAHISMQISSRTFAREKLEQYQSGEISQTELEEVTVPILRDAMVHIHEITAITRIGTDGRAIEGLYAAGEVLGSGFLGHAFLSGSVLSAAITFGRQLGASTK